MNKLLKNLRSLFGFYSKTREIKDAEGKKHELEHIYTDELGNNWYKLANFPVLPALRWFAVSPLLDSMNKQITAERLIKYMDSLINASFEKKDKDFKEFAVRTCSNIKERQTLLIDPEIAKGLIKYYLFIDGEGEAMEDKYIKKKMKAIQQDEQAFFFFTAMLFNAMTKQANISPTDIQAYYQSEEVRRILQNR